MAVTGDWPPWVQPHVRVITHAPTGAAETAWADEVAAALTGAEPSRTDDLSQRPIAGLGLSTVFQLRDLMEPGVAAAVVPSPVDTELPSSVAERLRSMVETVGAAIAPPSEASTRPRRASTIAALRALGAARSVSVVVPNYNYARYIEDRLRQIDWQAYPVSEIIVLDDASTDNSAARIRALIPTLATPARLIVNDRNSGSAFRQWEKGVAAATGELVWIAEVDDCAAPDFLARLAPAFDDPALVMAQSQSRQIGPEGELRYDDYGFYLAEVGAERWAQSYRADGREQAASTLAVMNTIPNVSAALFRRDALADALAASAAELETFRLAGDWLVYLEVLSRGSFAFARQALNDHRVHEGSVTTSALTPLDRVLEVGRMQKIARDRMSPPAEIEAAATAYLQKLYDYFGLAEDAPAAVYDHPVFAPLAPGR